MAYRRNHKPNVVRGEEQKDKTWGPVLTGRWGFVPCLFLLSFSPFFWSHDLFLSLRGSQTRTTPVTLSLLRPCGSQDDERWSGNPNWGLSWDCPTCGWGNRPSLPFWWQSWWAELRDDWAGHPEAREDEVSTDESPKCQMGIERGIVLIAFGNDAESLQRPWLSLGLSLALWVCKPPLLS